ncbi:MAG: hypothetical protein ACTHVE_07525 [Senegalia sp. (in: firmicutes)]|uniref:hypothetical protein n=1 Tax=Senegalia sp. (in: firmicutes) TaxID=1924098 RepID=UPI003F96B1C7
MDDKVFTLLEKMYVEMQGMKQNMTTMESKMTAIESNMTTMESNMATKHDIVRLENKMDTNFKALYDGLKLNTEKLYDVETRLGSLEDKVEKNELEIRVIKGAN